MSIFSKIMDAISWKGTRPTQTGQTPKPAPTTTPAAPSASTPAPAPTAPAPAPVSQFDVEANLSEMAQDKDLNWRTSIVDLMKLLGIDSSLANRKELARELGYTGALDGSAEMNIWLHKATMRKLAQNGGKVPASMLD